MQHKKHHGHRKKHLKKNNNNNNKETIIAFAIEILEFAWKTCPAGHWGRGGLQKLLESLKRQKKRKKKEKKIKLSGKESQSLLFAGTDFYQLNSEFSE